MGSSGIGDRPVSVRASYFNLYKWPESDAEFIKSIIFPNVRNGGDGRSSGEPRVVDGLSCRQLYLRSYTFSSKKDYAAIKRLGRIKDKIKTRSCGRGGRKSADDSIFRRLLSCTIKIDVMD